MLVHKYEIIIFIARLIMVVRHCISAGAEIQCLGNLKRELYNTNIARRRDNMNTSNKRILKIIKAHREQDFLTRLRIQLSLPAYI